MSSGMLFGAKRPARQHSDNWVGVFDCDFVGTELAKARFKSTWTRAQTPANHKDDDDDDEDAEEDGFGFEVSLVSSCTSRSQEPAGHAADALCSSKNRRATKLHPCNLRRDLNNFLNPKLD